MKKLLELFKIERNKPDEEFLFSITYKRFNIALEDDNYWFYFIPTFCIVNRNTITLKMMFMWWSLTLTLDTYKY